MGVKIKDKEYRKLGLDLPEFVTTELNKQLLESLGKYCKLFFFCPTRKDYGCSRLLGLFVFFLKLIYFKMVFFILRPILARQSLINELVYKTLDHLWSNHKNDYNNLLILKSYINESFRNLDEILIEKNKEISELKLHIKLLEDEIRQIRDKSSET